MERYKSFNKELAEAVRTIREEHFGLNTRLIQQVDYTIENQASTEK
jgi:hypothetical protein